MSKVQQASFTVGQKGRKTGFSVKDNVKKDASNLDDLEDFWADEESTRRLQLSYHTDDISLAAAQESLAGDGDLSMDHPDLSSPFVVNEESPVNQKRMNNSVQSRREQLEQLERSLGIVSPSRGQGELANQKRAAESVRKSALADPHSPARDPKRRKSVSFLESMMDLQQSSIDSPPEVGKAHGKSDVTSTFIASSFHLAGEDLADSPAVEVSPQAHAIHFDTPQTATIQRAKAKGAKASPEHNLTKKVELLSPTSPQEQALIKHLDFTDDLESPSPKKPEVVSTPPKNTRAAKKDLKSKVQEVVEESPQHVHLSSSPIAAAASPLASPSPSPSPKRAPPATKATKAAAAVAATAKQPKATAAPPKQKAPSKLESVKKRRKVEVEEDEDDEDEEDIGDESFRYDPQDEEDSDEDDSEDDSTSLAPTPVSELKHPYGRLNGSHGGSRDATEEDDEPTNETSRPKRNRIKPLAYWNGEKAEYKIDRRASGSLQLPTIKNVIRNSPSRLERGARNAPKTVAQSMAAKGFKKAQVPNIPVLNATTEEEEELGLIKTADMADPQEVNSEHFLLSKDLITAEFTTGFLVIPKGVTKSSKRANSSMIFYVVSGAVEVTIYKTTVELKTGAQFYVPEKNHYSFRNDSGSHGCKLFYVRLTGGGGEK